MIGLWLRAGRRFACFLSCRVALSLGARSLSSCLRFGFSSIGSPCFSACLVGSRLSPPGPVLYSSPCSLSRAFPTACLLSAPPVSSVGFGCVVALCPTVPALSIAWRCRVIPSMRCLASPRRCRLFVSFPVSFPLRLILSVPPASRPLCSARLRSPFRLASSCPAPIVGLLVSPCLGLVSGLPSCGHRAVCPVPPFVPLCLSEDGAACCAVVSYRLGRLVA